MDKNFWNQNIALLEKKDPHLYQEMVSYAPSEKSVFVETAKDGNKTVYTEQHGKRTYIHSKYSPVREGLGFAGDLEIQSNSILIIFGLGFGYHIRALLKQMKSMNHIIVFEPNKEMFYTQLQEMDCSDILESPKVHIFFYKDAESTYETVKQLIGPKNYHRTKIIELPSYGNIYQEEIVQFLEGIKKVQINNMLQRNTNLYFSREWQKTSIANLQNHFKSYPVSNLFGEFQKKPVVVVSAGPSLNKNMHLLKEIKEKALIIAVDTAVRPLVNAGIMPDLFIAVDSQWITYMKVMGSQFYNIPIIYFNTTAPSILYRHRGVKIFADHPQSSFFSEMISQMGITAGIINGDGSVACYAFDAARKLGGDPIIFVGQDLAYSAGLDHSHAQGTTNDKYTPAVPKNTKLHYVEDVYGNQVPTSYTMASYLHWIQDQILADDSGTRYIDATEGGAKIKGTQIMKLKDVAETYCKNEIHVFEHLKKCFAKGKTFQGDQQQIALEQLRNSYQGLLKFKQNIEPYRPYYDKLISVYQKDQNPNSKNIIQILRKMDPIYEMLHSIDEKSLIIIYMQPVFYELSKSAQKDIDELQNLKELAQRMIFIYQQLDEALTVTLKELEAILPKIEKYVDRRNLVNQDKLDTLDMLMEYLAGFQPGTERIVSLLRQGNTGEAVRLMPFAIDGMEWSINAINLCQSELKKPIDTTAINEALKEMLSAMENADYVLLADLLEYEILTIFQQWQQDIEY